MSIEAETGATFRVSSRVVMLDQYDTVLHFGGSTCKDGIVRWFTPGGGVEPGETPAAAAIREVREETGYAVDPAALVGPVGFGVYACFPERRLMVQKNWYFFLRAERFEPRNLTEDDYELELGYRWVPLDECGTTDGMLNPELLVSLVKRVRDGDVPAEPVDLGGSYGPRFWD